MKRLSATEEPLAPSQSVETPPPYSQKDRQKSTQKDSKDDTESISTAAPAYETLEFRERLHHRLDRLLPRLAVPLALLVGAAITAGTTYALVARVQNLLATARVSDDPNIWIQAARTQAYDACYLGCSDCNDVSYAWNACARTALASVTGMECNAAKMWNWKDKYPIECLKAVGEFYKSDALESLKNSYRSQFAIVILTMLGGLVGGVVTYKLWKRVVRRREQRRRVQWGVKWPRAKDSDPWKTKEMSEIAKGGRGRPSRNRAKVMLVSFLALFGRAKAYSCTGHDAVHDQYFTNANKTIFGVAHGWFSNCYDRQQCSTSCSKSCRDGDSTGCSSSCATTCWTVVHSDKKPQAFVNDVLPKVQSCGFSLVDRVDDIVNVRVANAGIERNWWLKISVNGYNVTDTRDTDSQVLCLYEIGNVGK